MDNGGVLPPSLNRAVLVFAGLKERGPDFSERYVSRSLLHERWTRAKATLALLYAASSINVGPQTLYEIIVDQKFSYDGHKKILNRWMRRARYVSEHIFSRAADPELRAMSEKVLGMGDSERFPLPLMSAVEHKLLSNVFPTKA